METLQKQILTLSNKVEAIYAVIERLDMKLSQILPNSSDHTVIVPDIIDDNLPSPEIPLYDLDQDEFIGTKWEHKDILNDVLYSEINYQIGDQQITPEIQIQRLTAQLTAAYHRIAALEDQLLQQRVY